MKSGSILAGSIPSRFTSRRITAIAERKAITSMSPNAGIGSGPSRSSGMFTITGHMAGIVARSGAVRPGSACMNDRG